MSNTPKYDNDFVTLGYLKDFSNKETEKNNIKYSKNYGIQPSPPYYVNDTWTDSSGRLFVCISTRLVGNYNSADWKCVIDTQDYDALVVKSLDSIIDMLDVQTTDYKIETWLKSTDPSESWETDVEKQQHLYDFWKTYINGEVHTYIYNKFATNPVRYGWTYRDCSEEVWDTTDGHKNLFGKKPTTYEKHDLWRIEEDIDDFDLPEGCLPGDWAVCTQDNTEYNKEDWTNKTVYINLDELAKTVYTKTEIDSQYQVLEDEITTGLTKTENTILAEVSQTYTTKETTKYFVDDLGEVSDTVDAHSSSIASLELSVGQIKSEISDFADITVSSEDYGSVSISDVAEGEPVSIKIHPTNNQDISYLYPRINLYPSPTLYTTTRTLLFETAGYSIKYELPADLLYLDEENYDEFELNYESNQVVVTKRVSIDEYGVKSKLETPVVTNYPFPSLPLQAGDYTITLLGHTYAYIFVRLLVANIYTDQFPTKAQMNSAITQTAASINSEVAKKVGKTEIISTINQTAEEVLIDASRINMVGVITAINNNTTTTINGNKITTGTITADKLKAGTITADQIASSAITTDKIATNAITANKISGGAITSEKIDAGAITTAKIASSAITSDKIQTGAITADKIQAGSVTSSKVSSDIITTTNFSAQKINADNITTGTISADRLDTSKINAITGTIGGWSIDTTNLSKQTDRYSFEIRTDRPENEPSLLVWDKTNNRYAWYVRTDGYMYARNATVSGTINANYGNIGKWSISDGKLYGSSDGYEVSLSPAYLYARAPGDSWEQLRWYSLVFQFSDKNVKNNIKNIEEKYNILFDNLKPVTFKYKDEYETRKLNLTHIGFVAQDIQEAQKEAGLEDLSLIYGEKILKLDKQEIIALNTWQIQRLKKIISSLELKITKLEEKICQ